MDNRNICVLTRTLLIGGAEKQALLLAYSLKQEYNIFLVSLFGDKTDTKFSKFIEEKNINTIYLEGNILAKFLKFYKFLKLNRINFIFAYIPITNVFAALAGILAGVKFLFGGIRTSSFIKHKLIIQRFLHNYIMTFSISNSNFSANKLTLEGFNSKKLLVIPNGIEIKKPIPKLPNNKLIDILSVGRFHIAKDYLTALKAINHLLEIIPEYSKLIKYRIIGYGELEKDIRSWIKEYKLEKNVELILNSKDLDSYYKNSDIYLCTSIFEGLSNSIMEAMNFSLPIVATNNVGDNSYLVVDGLNGYLCNMKDYKTMAEKLKILITNNNKRIQMGSDSYERLKNNYSLELFRKRYIELIENSI